MRHHGTIGDGYEHEIAHMPPWFAKPMSSPGRLRRSPHIQASSAETMTAAT